MKTSELTGTALDWAVAKAEGWKDWVADGEAFTWAPDGCGWLSLESYKPSTDWAQGGPIIEREGISLSWGPRLKEMEWEAECNANEFHNKQYGQTPLIAAMRCYVASKLGDYVNIPDEITG